MSTINILDLELDELKKEIESMGEPAFRTKQVWQWPYLFFAKIIL